jgi:hypothetical protein
MKLYKMASVVSSTGDYLKDHHPRFAKLLSSFGVHVDRTALVLIPADKELAKFEAEVDKVTKTGGDKMCSSLRELSTKMSVLCIHQFVDDKYDGGEAVNKAEQLIKISKVSGGIFEVKSGAKYDTVAKCKLLPIVGAPFHSKDECRMLSVASITTGSVATDGVKQEKRKRGKLEGGGDRCRCLGDCCCGDKFDGGAIQETISSGDVLQLKSVLFEDLIVTSEYSKKNYFAPCIAGIVKTLSLYESRFPEDISTFCKYYTKGCYGGAFISMIAPEGRSSLLSDSFIKKWMGAPYYPKDTSISSFVDSFVAKHSSYDTTSYRSKYNHGFLFDAKTTSGIIKGIYANVKEVYGADISQKKMWADCINYKCHKIISERRIGDLRKLADLCKGDDCIGECEVACEYLWDSSIEQENKPETFIREWLLMGKPDPLEIPSISGYMESVIFLNTH